MNRAAFLDRDGVINYDSGYVHRWEDFVFVPGAVEGMATLQRAGFKLILITNQAGVARGMYSIDHFNKLTQQLRLELLASDVFLSGIYFCPHHPDGLISEFKIRCSCRKPEPGMILRAAVDLNIDLGGSVLVGDRILDVVAGRRAGIDSCYLVQSTNYTEDEAHVSDGVFSDLLACSNYIVNRPGLTKLPLD